MGTDATISRHVGAAIIALLLVNTCSAEDAVAVAAADAAAANDGCAAMYSNADRPLLFGGVHGGCTGSRCQPRGDEW